MTQGGTPLRESIRLRLRRIVVERGLTYDGLARRTGLHARTIERFLEGETFAVETADTLAAALRVPWEPTDEVLVGLDLWQLRGELGWWARMRDLAAWLGTGRAALSKRVLRGVRSSTIDTAEIRGNVRQDAVVPSRNNWTNPSNRGCTMLSTRACLWLVLTSESEPSVRALGALIEDGVERMRAANASVRR